MWYVDVYGTETTRWGPFKTYAEAHAFASQGVGDHHIYEESS